MKELFELALKYPIQYTVDKYYVTLDVQYKGEFVRTNLSTSVKNIETCTLNCIKRTYKAFETIDRKNPMKCKIVHREVTTPFCPECGIKIDRGSPESLLMYVDNQIEYLRSTDKDAGRWIEWGTWIKKQLET